jgi:Skp family chaperone for outer membrane proteins
MSRPMQTLTLGVALGAAVMAGTFFASTADANRAVAPYEHGIGYVDVFGLVDQIVLQPEATAARVAFEAQGQTAAQSLQQEAMALQGQLQGMDQNDPAGGEVYMQAQMKQQELQNFYQEYQAGMQSLIAGQIGDAYKQVHAAAKAVAAEQGVTFVFATRPDSDLLQTDSISGVAQEILARPLIAPAASTDLTALVRANLGLPEPTEEAPVTEPAQDAGQPDAQPADQPATDPATQPATQPAGN